MTTADGGERTTTYAACIAPVAPSGSVQRDGVVRVHVANPTYCASGQIQTGDVVQVELAAYRQVERDGAAPPRLDLQATLTIERTGRGTAGCAGATVDERWTGTVTLDCQPDARTLACGPRPRTLVLTADDLGEAKRSQLAPSCTRVVTVSGTLRGEDVATGERVGVAFSPFELRTRALPGGAAQEVSVGGTLVADCLGAVTLSGIVQLAEAGGCPVAGALSPGRSSANTGTGAAAASRAASRAAPPVGVLREQLFRAGNGRVYQVVQNTGSDVANGAEAVQLTTLAASAGAQVRFCGATSGSDGPPAAAVGVTLGGAVPLAQVRGSGLLASAAPPRFDQNAADGDGRVCVGSDCSADARCAAGQSCVALGTADLAPLQIAAPARPAAQLTQAPAESCADVAGLATYAFGSAAPTTRRAVCQSVPSDGITLGSGQSVVFTYDVPPLAQLNAGIAGLPVDLDGPDLLCSAAPNQVLSPGRATTDTAAAPQVTFAPAGAALDYDPPADGPGAVDDVLACVNGAMEGELLRCDTEPPVRQPLPCAAQVLSSADAVSVGGVLAADGLDRVPPPPCIWAAQEVTRDQVYQYTAPAQGTYVAQLASGDFLPVLHARAGDCEGPLLGGAACQADGVENARDGVAELTLELAAGQTVALVADARRGRAGAFSFAVRRKLPDLAIRGVSAAAAAQAGELMVVSAEIANLGDQDAGPFSVEFLVARDAALTDVVSSAPLVCNVAGLAAGAATTCAPANRLPAPLVAAGAYFIGVRVDPQGEIDESAEGNNTASQGLSIAAAPGVTLRQEILRAADGTTYQIVTAVPTLTRTDAGSFQLTSQTMTAADIGAATLAVDTCATVQSGKVRAAVGSQAPIAPAAVRRTAILRPSGFPTATLEVAGRGRLHLGRDGAEVEVCADQSCGGAPLVPLDSAGGGVPAACAASRAGGFCGDGTAAATLGFGIAANDGVCSDASRPTSQVGVCAVAPSDGVRLRPGEQVVFVSDTDRGAVSAGIAGFALASDAQNPRGCVANSVFDAIELHRNTAELPLFRIVQRELSGAPADVAISPDGRHVYVIGGGGVLTAYERVAGAPAVRQIDVQREGELSATGVRIGGLYGGFRLLMSPDGAHVYVLGFYGIGIFQRDVEGGTLAFRGAIGVNSALDARFSPDGEMLYVGSASGNGTLMSFRRDPDSGGLDAVDTLPVPLMAGLGVSPDSAYVYAGAQVFRRNPQTDVLVAAQSLPAALVQPAVSGDGAALFALEQDGVALYRRTPDDGSLTFLYTFPLDPAVRAGVGGIIASPTGSDFYLASPGPATVLGWRFALPAGGLPQVTPVASVSGLPAASLQLSRDGASMIARRNDGPTVALLGRDAVSGALTPLGSADISYHDVDLPFGTVLTVSPDGGTVYSNDGGLRADRRDPFDGHLGMIGRVPGAPPLAIAVSPDSRHVYAAAGNALTVYRRDPASGVPAVVDVQQDGVDGIDGLADVSSVVVSPDGKHVYASGSGDDAVVAFSRDATSGTLQSIQVLRASAQVALPGPHALAITPDGKQLYVLTEQFGALLVLQRDAASGLLSPDGSVLDLQPDGMSTLAVSADGRNVYVAVPSSNEVRGYTRDPESGALTYATAVAVPFLAAPLVASSDGTLLYANTLFGAAVLARDPATGDLSSFDRLPAAFDEGFIGLAVSPDDRNVYVSGQVFGRALHP